MDDNYTDTEVPINLPAVSFSEYATMSKEERDDIYKPLIQILDENKINYNRFIGDIVNDIKRKENLSLFLLNGFLVRNKIAGDDSTETIDKFSIKLKIFDDCLILRNVPKEMQWRIVLILYMKSNVLRVDPLEF